MSTREEAAVTRVGELLTEVARLRAENESLRAQRNEARTQAEQGMWFNELWCIAIPALQIYAHDDSFHHMATNTWVWNYAGGNPYGDARDALDKLGSCYTPEPNIDTPTDTQ